MALLAAIWSLLLRRVYAQRVRAALPQVRDLWRRHSVMLLVLMLSTAQSAEVPSDALLKQLTAHDERMEKYLDTHAVLTHVTGHELDGDGKVAHMTTALIEQTRKNGQIDTRVVEAKRDDADDVEGEKERAAKRDKENKRTESPFAARNIGKYSFLVLDHEKPLHLAFVPKDGPQADVFVGEAWVDTEAGEVVKLTLKPSKNPPLVDRLDMVLEYDEHTDAGRMLSKFSFVGEGGVLMFKRRGNVEMTFSYP
jgi:hypothetical protein